jgi:ankyrin repeat protein
VKSLIQAGAKLNLRNQARQTALIVAATEETVSLLIQAGALLDLQDSGKNSALLQSIKNSKTEIAR